MSGFYVVSADRVLVEYRALGDLRPVWSGDIRHGLAFTAPQHPEAMRVAKALGARVRSGPNAGRNGTIWARRAELEAALGPGTPEDSDGKVTISWELDTPFGPAEISDYWWNGPTEWSVRAFFPTAARFAEAHVSAKLGRDVSIQSEHASARG